MCVESGGVSNCDNYACLRYVCIMSEWKDVSQDGGFSIGGGLSGEDTHNYAIYTDPCTE